MTTGVIPDPYVNFNFLVEIGGITRGAFQEVGGLSATIDVIEHREGGDNTTPRKLPGMTKHGNITLKWGMVDDTELYQWHQNIVNAVKVNGDLDRRNGSIRLLDRAGNEVTRWDFVRAWPTKYEIGQLSAEGNDVTIITMEIVHEGLTQG
jgi:phage tail-like protein